MTTQRIVTGHFESADGTPRAGETVTYRLEPWSFTTGAVIPCDTIVDTTDETGNSATLLWCNAEGMLPTAYTVTMPDGSEATFVLPVGVDPISLDELLLLHASIDWPPSTIGDYLEAAFETIYAAFANDSDQALGDGLVGMRHRGTGAVGRTVHDRLDDTWHSRDWGVVAGGDGEANALAINTAIAEIAASGGGVLHVQPGHYSFLRQVVVMDGVTLQGSGRGATLFDFTDAILPIEEVVPNSAIAAKGAVDVLSVQHSATIALHTRTIPFASDPGLVAGDIIIAFDSAESSFSLHRDVYRAGEFMRVAAPWDGTSVTITSPTYASYAAGSTVTLYKLTPIGVTITDLSCQFRQGSNGIVVDYGAACTLSNLDLTGTNYSNLLIRRSYEISIQNVRAVDFSEVSAGLNYGLTISNSQRINVGSGSYFESSRHGVTSGGGSTECTVPNRELIFNGITVSGSGTTGGTNGMDLHGNTEYVIITNCVFPNGVTISGDHVAMRGCTLRGGGRGIQLYFSELLGSDMAIEDNTFSLTTDHRVGFAAVNFPLRAQATHAGGTFRFAGNRMYCGTYKNETTETTLFLNAENTASVGPHSVEVVNNTIISELALPDVTGHVIGINVLGYRNTTSLIPYGWRRVTVSGNSLQRCGVRLESCSADLYVLQDNTVVEPLTNGLSILELSESGLARNLATVKGNTVIKARNTGIYVSGAATGPRPLDVRMTHNESTNANQVGDAAPATAASILVSDAHTVVFQHNTVGDEQTVPTQLVAYALANVDVLHEDFNTILGSVLTVSRTTIAASNSLILPIDLTIVPRYTATAPTTSPFYSPVTGGQTIRWLAAHATQDLAYIRFLVPRDLHGRTVAVKAQIVGTATSEDIIIKTYVATYATGGSLAWSTSNGTEQTTIAVAAGVVVVNLRDVITLSAGETMMIAFRPRTPADANVAQDKQVIAAWLE